MDVGGWLRGLGLGKYEAAFLDNGIGEAVLPHLTVEDLKEIGVATVGDRRMLLAAIAALATPKSSGPIERQTAPALPVKAPEVFAERRPITVMFCDLVGSTGIAAKLDAEDWRNLVNAYLDAASTAVTALGGHVLKRLGDGLMALFGYPQAQENDAERAVRAALAIQRALADLNARNAARRAPELKARIGIESGPAVVEATGEVFGDGPNVAARVEAAAEPGAVLVTLNVQRQIAGLFVAEDEGARELKGVSAPVQLFRIVRASGGGRRRGARALTPFVGRDEELALLTHGWERSLSGEGQLVLIVGEPGLGKSRLVDELHSCLNDTPHTWVEWRASQLLQNTALHPVAEWGRLRFGEDTPAEDRLADLEGTLRLIGLDPAEQAPLLAPLVDIPLPAGRALNLAPEELRRKQLAAMTAWFLAGAKSQPVVLAFEDLHWADPTSLDLLHALAERGAQAPLLILATARPEFRPPWSLRSHHGVISLAPLDHAGVARMVGEISARHALSEEVVEGVSERTGGVPLFVEEVTRLLLERGDGRGAQAIPPTLQQSLAARLDRLGSAREIAQICAALGREFGYRLIREVAEADDAALRASLDRLADAGLLYVEGLAPHATYRFKHALIQDAAYDSLLRSRRQALHRRAAEVLRDDPERAFAAPEIVAHHFTEAGLDDAAIEWWGKAGDQALRRSAFQEAIAHLGKAITMADKAAGASSPAQKLHVAYGNALIAARGHGASETTEAFARAREKAEGETDSPQRLAADYGLWVGSLVRGELPSMRAHAAAFLADVEERPDSSEAGVAHRTAGLTHWFAGEYREAREHLERALALFQPGRDDDLAFRFGQDQGVATMLWLGLTVWSLGHVGRAISLDGEVEARLARLDHIATRAYGRTHLAMFELMRGDLSRAASNAAELGRVTREHDLPVWRACEVFLRGLTDVQSGEAGGGLAAMRHGVELLREQNSVWLDGLLKIALAEAEARAGDAGRAVAVLDEALATCERNGHRAFEAELHRIRGEMLLRRDPASPAPAEEAFQAAIAVAKQQATRSFELRAALALAKLYRSTGRPAEAHAVLAPALNGFAPTPEMPEIAEAQALLAALAETGEVQAAETRRRRRLNLQTAYGQAMMWSKGFAADETRAAFEPTDQIAEPAGGAPARFVAYYAKCLRGMMRGEYGEAREIAETFLREAEAEGRETEAGAARRELGLILLNQGELSAARSILERALDECVARRSDETQFALDWDTDGEASAAAYLALAVWHLGEPERARQLMQRAVRRAESLGHIATIANVLFFRTVLESRRDDVSATRQSAEALLGLAEQHGIQSFADLSQVYLNWTYGRLVDAETGADALRRALTANIAKGDRGIAAVHFGLLAELEAATARGPASGLSAADRGLAIASEIGQRLPESYLHRLRGELLLRRSPAHAEDAFRTAIAIAQRQGARSPCLLASLSLAKLYRSTARPVDAHAVLAPALEGFLPTPEMPEIAEAQALLAALAETDEVKAEAASRRRRFELQWGYRVALAWNRGSAAEETLAAAARTDELAAESRDPAARFALYPMQFHARLIGGETGKARSIAQTYLEEATNANRLPHVALASILLGEACLTLGAFSDARRRLLQALEIYDRAPGVNFESINWTVYATLVLATVHRHLGEAVRARELIEKAKSFVDADCGVTFSITYTWTPFIEALRGDAGAVMRDAHKLAEISAKLKLPLSSGVARIYCGWARARLQDPQGGLEELRRGLAELGEQKALVGVPFYQGLLAELEAEGPSPAIAVPQIDEALALAERTGQRATDSLLHCIRGDILLKADPENPARAEDAYVAAVAIAREQGTRIFGLRAALSLAKLYQSIRRRAEAHAALAPALKGFAPTPEVPEIAEAKALLERLA